ncbi:LOW QUALITY PROTEIN: next to BRCA1 gene 1 protein-like [Sinocyclocheilus anshuiensis]|uniref:LOW QUALITY PROTEIN: next to BRCA1 gene 1 protein-like n=1 Tax=Sinocyclocheilus anshuiensis TaxID=1608454 RepID=UPI0007BA68D3|nr:PREDICTED: LOW QUALITY PROTEIN: next to BRCA1 gene 1 protein-like [Sinocyclocheilus anshuiensis]
MNLPVTVKVNFRGNVKKFPVLDTNKAQWETVEAWIKTTFGLIHFQVKYFDEDNEEVCINCQDEYTEALKSAFKQANQLHMNVYKMKGQAEGGAVKAELKELKIDPRPAPPYRARVKMADKETQVTPERDSAVAKENKGMKTDEEAVPTWFKSYMDRFKDQVVREVVDRMCSEFSGQCCTHTALDPPAEEPSTSGTQKATSSTTLRASSSTPNCSSWPCSHKHDPSHNLKRTWTPLSVPERGVTPEPRFLRRGDRTVRKAERQRLKAERRQLKAEVKEIKKKLRLEKRGLLWSGASSGTGSSGLAPAPATSLGPGPAPAPALCPDPQTSSPEGPKVSCSTLVPTMTALFLDENLPDGTCLEPGTKFIKYWKMRNTGNISWTSDTKLRFMWGNLTLGSREQKEVAVPFLQPGQVGVVSVAFVAPLLEGTYTSHWRLAHCGVQFGPRVWCSIIVVPSAEQKPTHCSKSLRTDLCLMRKDGMFWSGTRDCEVSTSSRREYYFPSVDLLMAQDLLSFELLDINIVQELEKVPANTPADMTPCVSPPFHHGPLFGKHGTGLSKVEAGHSGRRKSQVLQPQRQNELLDVPGNEEGDEDISGTQFVCETVIRSLTLEEEPERKPQRRAWPNLRRHDVHDTARFQERSLLVNNDRPLANIKRPEAPVPVPKPVKTEETVIPVFSEALFGSNENLYTDPAAQDENEEEVEQKGHENDQEKEEEAGEWDEVNSQVSSASSEDYIVILPDCFDTSRPLGESMYSSAMSQPAVPLAKEPEAPQIQSTAEGENEEPIPVPALQNSLKRMLCTSQILDTPPLIPEMVPPPIALSPAPSLRTHRSVRSHDLESGPGASEDNTSCQPDDDSSGCRSAHLEAPVSAFETCGSQDLRARHGGLTEGLVKGALSVAASAYKALFTGQSTPAERPAVDPACEDASMMAVLQEMGFSNQPLNQRLLRKHHYNLLDVVNELVQLTDSEWHISRH